MKLLFHSIAVLLFFILPMLTSWLLDLEWISAEWSRQGLVYILMLLEMALIVLIVKDASKNNKQL